MTLQFFKKCSCVRKLYKWNDTMVTKSRQTFHIIHVYSYIFLLYIYEALYQCARKFSARK